MADNTNKSKDFSKGNKRVTGGNSPQDVTNASNENSTSCANVFKNDGSFLEMFKKKLEEENRRKQAEPATRASSSSLTMTSRHSEIDTGSGTGGSATNDAAKVNITGNININSRLKDEFVEPKNVTTDMTASGTSSEQSEQKTEPQLQKSSIAKKKYSLLSHVGKRPGGKLTLKTGQVKKPKQSDQESTPKDAWSKYMSEVEKYKAHVCSDDDKVRPLVK